MFKIGDKVKCIKSHYCGVTAGNLYPITSFYTDSTRHSKVFNKNTLGFYIIKNGGVRSDGYWSFDYFENKPYRSEPLTYKKAMEILRK